MESELEGVFLRVRRFPVGGSRSYCPACWAERSRREGTDTLRRTLWAAVLGAFAALAFPRLFAGWMLLNLVLFEAAILGSTVPHELGHASAARLLGVRVFRIVIGFGRVAWQGRVLGFDLELRSVPVGGLTLTGFRDRRFFRIHHSLIVLAGPLVNAVMGGAVLLWVPWEAVWGRSPFAGIVPWAALVVANGVTLLVNLAPIRYRAGVGEVRSDGLALVTTPFLDESAIARILAVGFALEGIEARRLGRPEEALAWYEKGLARFPGDSVLRNARATALIDLDRHEEARDEILALLAAPDLDEETRTIAWNNLAWADVESGRSDLLDEADRWSEEAYRRAAWFPPVQSTRGAVLVVRGRLEEGTALLRRALAGVEEPKDRDAVSRYLARAESRGAVS